MDRFNIDIPIAMAAVFLAALTLAALLAVMFRGGRAARCWPVSAAAPQTLHRRPVPLLGGLAILAPLICFAAWQGGSGPMGAMLVSSLPILAAGLADDLGVQISPRLRLGAATASAALAIGLLGVRVDHFGLPIADAALAIVPVGVAVTLFGSAGAVNALNLTDGVNGLASGLGAIAATALGLIAQSAGQGDIAIAGFALAAALAGFFVVNVVSGAIFLGDGGAYLGGHLLFWLGLTLAARNPELNPLALLLTAAWPVYEVAQSIGRRWMAGRRIMSADGRHTHQLLYRLTEPLVGDRLRHLMAAAPILVLASLAATAGIVLSTAPGWHGAAALAAFVAAFVFLRRVAETAGRAFAGSRDYDLA